MAFALHHNGGRNTAQAALFFKLVDDDRGRVGQLVAGESKEFFAHHFGRHKALAAVGQVFGVVHPILLGQVLFANGIKALHVFGGFGRHGHQLGKGVALVHAAQPGGQLGAAVHVVELVGHQNHRNVGGQQSQHFGIGQIKVPRLHHKHNHVHIRHGAQHGFVERTVERIAMPRLKAWRIHKHKLRGPQRTQARDAVARGLRLARGDAHLLPHQGIEQCGLAHVGLTHNRHKAAALRAQVLGLRSCVCSSIGLQRLIGCGGFAQGLSQHGF